MNILVRMNEFDWSQCASVWRDPGRMAGQWCFKQSRMPVKFLFSNLSKGVTLDEFCEWFPPVTRAQCEDVLAFAAQRSAFSMAIEPGLAA